MENSFAEPESSSKGQFEFTSGLVNVVTTILKRSRIQLTEMFSASCRFSSS